MNSSKRSKLRKLRSRLNRLRWRRRILRLGSGVSSLLLSLILLVAAIYLLDWSLGMDRPQRAVLILIAAALFIWILRRLILPWFGKEETVLEMALLVEKREGIDSDLVASLEFESPEADQWGSRELEEAVIDSVAQSSRRLKVSRGFSWMPLLRRAVAMGFSGALLAGIFILFPGHTAAFLDRLLVGSSRYPTRCIIEEIAINGIKVRPAPAGVPGTGDTRSPAETSVPYGRPILVQVRCSGELPREGRVELEAREAGTKATFPLDPDRMPGSYSGTFPRLVESATYQIFLGDDWTDPAPLVVIPLPVVELELSSTPPSYARENEPSRPPAAGARQISVIEGSRIGVEVKAINKPLRDAILSLGEARYPLAAKDGEGHLWSLTPEGTPFECVLEPIRFQVQVVDADGLNLDNPLEGFIRIQPDRPPRVAAGLITRHVLPTARPRLSYSASDDYGLAALKIHYQVARTEGDAEEREEPIPLPATRQDSLRGEYSLNLEDLKVVKDDQVTVFLEAVDFRGSLSGESSRSEPLVLHITDERGVLAAMMETDEESARQLDAIIQKQLGIGESK